MAFQLVITDQGRAAVVDQAGGFRAVRVDTVGLSTRALAATPQTTALPGEVKRVATVSGDATAPDTFHLTVVDESDDTYPVRSLALYLADGTLFALYGQEGVIVEKSTQALLLLALDVILADLPAATITFGDARFSNPAATEQRAGVIALATQDQANDGADTRRALTPATASGAVLRWLGYTPVQQGTGVGQYANTVKIGWAGSDLRATVDTTDQGAFVFERGGDPVWRASNDGAGSGLDADLLDGHDGSYYASVSGRLGFTPVQQGTGGGQYDNTVKIGWSGHKLLATVDTTDLGAFVFDVSGDTVWRVGNDGAGSGLDADLLDGQDSSYYTDIPSRLGFTPVQQGGGEDQLGNSVKIGWSGSRLLATVDTSALGAFVFERGGDTVWRESNDGAGSGMDADLLDGYHADQLRDWNNLLNRPAIANTDSNIASKFPGRLIENGYVMLPNGLIFQWASGSPFTSSSGSFGGLILPILFPGKCLHAFVTMHYANQKDAVPALASVTEIAQGSVSFVIGFTKESDKFATPHVLAIGY